jgi:hypothetical protein
MKLYACQSSTGWVYLSVNPCELTYTCLGTVDLPIVAPKKTVTREAERSFVTRTLLNGDIEIYFRYPPNARNVKCTYEVEE